MNFTLDINTLLTTLVGIAVVKGVRGIVSIDRKLTVQNGRLVNMETWKDGHEKLDDERHSSLINSLADLRESIQNSIGSMMDNWRSQK